mmetsp:Transcript_8650/g.14644  ORF Transcript_8650/g.14644 Transcript_8650/m.14644 type:complete len:200 (-) Transcript_8650:112-711(-)
MHVGLAHRLRMHCAMFSCTSKLPLRIIRIMISTYSLLRSIKGTLSPLQVMLYSTFEMFSTTSSFSALEISRIERTTGLRFSNGAKRTLTYFNTLEQFSRTFSGTPGTQMICRIFTMLASSSSLRSFAAKATTARSIKETSFHTSMLLPPRICASILVINSFWSNSSTQTLEEDICTSTCRIALFIAASLLSTRNSSRLR